MNDKTATEVNGGARPPELEPATRPAPTPREIVPGLLNLVLKVEQLTFQQRHELLLSLDFVLKEWVELKELMEDLSGPKEAPSANP